MTTTPQKDNIHNIAHTLLGTRPNTKTLKRIKKAIKTLGVPLTHQDVQELKTAITSILWRFEDTSPDRLEFLCHTAETLMDIEIPAWNQEFETWDEGGVQNWTPGKEDTLDNLWDVIFHWEDDNKPLKDIIVEELQNVTHCIMIDEAIAHGPAVLKDNEDQINFECLLVLVETILHSTGHTHETILTKWLNTADRKQDIVGFVRTHASRSVNPDVNLGDWIEAITCSQHAMDSIKALSRTATEDKPVQLHIDCFDQFFETEDDELEDNPTTLIIQNKLLLDKQGNAMGQNADHRSHAQRMMMAALRDGISQGGLFRVQRNLPINAHNDSKPTVEVYCATMGPDWQHQNGYAWLSAEDSKNICEVDTNVVRAVFRTHRDTKTGEA